MLIETCIVVVNNLKFGTLSWITISLPLHQVSTFLPKSFGKHLPTVYTTLVKVHSFPPVFPYLTDFVCVIIIFYIIANKLCADLSNRSQFQLVLSNVVRGPDELRDVCLPAVTKRGIPVCLSPCFLTLRAASVFY